MAKITKAALIRQIAEETDLSKAKVTEVFASLEGIAKANALDGEIPLPGIGKIKAVFRPARMAKNPRTGEDVQIPDRVVPRFTYGKLFKDAIQ